MGLSNAISGGIVMFGITYVLFAFSGLTDNTASISYVSSQTSDLENKLLKTSINATINDPPGTDAIFDFEIKNTNLEKLWEFDKFDVIITYDSGGITHTQTLTYDSVCPPVAGEWCINTWTDDVLDPEILNNSETITIRAEVDNNLQTGTNLIVVVSTSNGVVASVTRTV